MPSGIVSGLFLVLPIVVLYLRFSAATQWAWWKVIALQVSVGWLLLALRRYFHQQELNQLIASYGGVSLAPSEIVQRWESDGAGNVSHYFGGWLLSLVYFGLFAAGYALLLGGIRLLPVKRNVH